MKKKTLIMLLSATLAVASVAMGTIAYLTSTAGIVNTFTVGGVTITLDETQVDPSGQPVMDPDDPTVPLRTPTGNEYHLLPGQSYLKDPTMTVKANSEPSYVRMLVTITHIDQVRQVLGADFLPENYVSNYDPTVWKCVAIVEGSEQATDPATQQPVTVYTATYEFRYPAIVGTVATDTEPAADKVLLPLFTHINVPANLTAGELSALADMQVRVVGEAIQATGFTTEDEAWTAFGQQTAPQP